MTLAGVLAGNFLLRGGEPERGERWFTEASKVPGMLGEAYGNLGVIALRRGQPKEAQWFLSRAAKRRPQRALLRYNYALALFSNNRPEDALNELHVAQTLEPSDAATQFFTGVVALRVGLVSEAERCFREACAWIRRTKTRATTWPCWNRWSGRRVRNGFPWESGHGVGAAGTRRYRQGP